MNSPLEERLHAHLGADASTSPTNDAALGAVKKLARRRSMTTRVAAGAFGLAALVGLGSLVPTSDTADSLITATQPTVTSEATAPTPAPASPSPVAAPTGYGVVTDGQGGFVARKFPSSQGTVQFVRSADGETWFDAEVAQLPDAYGIEQLRFEDGFFVLELDGEGVSSDPNTEPYLARSRDLVSWEIIDLGLRPNNPDGPQTTTYLIGDIAINGDDLAVVVLEFGDINYKHFDLLESEVCAIVADPSALTLSLCDGTLISSETVPRPAVVQHVLVSRSGAPATELPEFEPTQDSSGWSWQPVSPIPQGGAFVAVEYETDPTTVVSAETTAMLAELGEPLVLAARSAAGQALLLVEVGGELMTVLTSTTDSDVDDVITPLPDSFNQWAGDTSYSVDHGSSGWTITVYETDADLIEVERNGWQFSGYLSWFGARLRSVEESEQVYFAELTAQLPQGVHVGLFGGTRYFHPVTGELLVELSAQETTSPAIEALQLEQANFDRTIEVDGWTIGGHPLYGPLTLTSPTGDVTEYPDGFAFDNDDITDGVETDISTASFGQLVLQRADVIRFYDDAGVEVVSVRGRELFAELVEPVLDTIDGASELKSTSLPGRFPNHSPVLHSRDGSEWALIWSSDDVDDGDPSWVSNLAVGDDEILVATFDEIVRIPIDD